MRHNASVPEQFSVVGVTIFFYGKTQEDFQDLFNWFVASQSLFFNFANRRKDFKNILSLSCDWKSQCSQKELKCNNYYSFYTESTS